MTRCDSSIQKLVDQNLTLKVELTTTLDSDGGKITVSKDKLVKCQLVMTRISKCSGK